jgi:cold shock CspA family protein
VERPISRYLHKYDDHYKRIAPDYALQYKTLEQQYLYEGDFSLLVREVTKKGAVVQDSVTGAFGFVPKKEFGGIEPEVGSVVPGAKCTSYDVSTMSSPDVDILRTQNGIVFEWDRAKGEGYIMPTEGQEARKMLRVFRRDINWHGSRQLCAGQFVQFETARNFEVPIEPNDEPESSFALRVSSPEVIFSFKDSKTLYLRGSQSIDEQPNVLANVERDVTGYLSAGAGEDDAALAKPKGGYVLPAESGRPPTRPLSRAHPALQKFAEVAPAIAKAESPSYLWEAPMMDYLEDFDSDGAPIIPVQYEKPLPKQKFTKILASEEVVRRGDYLKERDYLRGKFENMKLRPFKGAFGGDEYGRTQAERMSIEADNKNLRRQLREEREQKLRATGRLGKKKNKRS